MNSDIGPRFAKKWKKVSQQGYRTEVCQEIEKSEDFTFIGTIASLSTFFYREQTIVDLFLILKLNEHIFEHINCPLSVLIFITDKCRPKEQQGCFHPLWCPFLYDVHPSELVHSVETGAPKLFFTKAPKNYHKHKNQSTKKFILFLIVLLLLLLMAKTPWSWGLVVAY